MPSFTLTIAARVHPPPSLAQTMTAAVLLNVLAAITPDTLVQAAQDAARDWLRTALGVVHDAGHVQALCGLAQQHARPYAFLIALVNTRAYLPRTVQWHDLQNHSAPLGVSRVASLFEFS